MCAAPIENLPHGHKRASCLPHRSAIAKGVTPCDAQIEGTALSLIRFRPATGVGPSAPVLLRLTATPLARGIISVPIAVAHGRSSRGIDVRQACRQGGSALLAGGDNRRWRSALNQPAPHPREPPQRRQRPSPRTSETASSNPSHSAQPGNRQHQSISGQNACNTTLPR